MKPSKVFYTSLAIFLLIISNIVWAFFGFDFYPGDPIIYIISSIAYISDFFLSLIGAAFAVARINIWLEKADEEFQKRNQIK